MKGLAAGRPLLLVYRDDAVRRVLSQRLTREGFDVLEATELRESPLGSDLRVVLLQLDSLGGLSPLAIVREDSQVPVIGLLDDLEAHDVAAVLEAGADDCVVRPFSPRELVARVKAVLRRVRSEPTVVVRGRLTIDVAAREATLDDRLLDLPPRQFDLLVFFVRHPREVITRARLLEEVWGSSSSWQSDETVTEHVFRLRQQLEDDPGSPKMIRTVRGVGYRFED